MKIGIDFRTALNPHKAGKGWYTYHLVRALLQIDKENSYSLYTDLRFKITDYKLQIPDNAVIKQINGNAVTWHFKVIQDCKKNGVDVFFAPTSFIIPSLLSSAIRSVIVVHDLVAFLFPNIHQTKATIIEKLFLKRALAKTNHVICVSENTKKDLCALFTYPEEKISVIYPAAALETTVLAPQGQPSTKQQMPQKYILGVGTIEPRKNFQTLIKAYELFHAKHPDVHLVIVGGEGWKSTACPPKPRSAGRRRVNYYGYTQPAELAGLYRNALAFIFPSLYEGFGMPPLEAMSAGCPVICSNTSSLPEVVGAAAIQVEPMDGKAIAAALEKIVSHEIIRKIMIEKGYAQAEKFSWDVSARRLLAIFNHLRSAS